MTPAEARPILLAMAERQALTPWEREALLTAANLFACWGSTTRPMSEEQ